MVINCVRGGRFMHFNAIIFVRLCFYFVRVGMIPLKLQVKNFLSYGSDIQEIDFRPYHLICLSGKNGHGKSALLDAITWAVWGQARKVTNAVKADQNLLHLGQTQMMVL